MRLPTKVRRAIDSCGHPRKCRTGFDNSLGSAWAIPNLVASGPPRARVNGLCEFPALQERVPVSAERIPARAGAIESALSSGNPSLEPMGPGIAGSCLSKKSR